VIAPAGRHFLSDARRARPASLTSLAAILTCDLTIDMPARAASNLLRAGIHHAHDGGRPKHQLQTAPKMQLNFLCKDILRQEPKSFATVAKSIVLYPIRTRAFPA
jgi:hypothetical protein